jgi:hypothetical protein
MDEELFTLRPINDMAISMNVPADLLWQGVVDRTLRVVRCRDDCKADIVDKSSPCRACLRTCRGWVEAWLHAGRLGMAPPAKRETIWVDGAANYHLDALIYDADGSEDAAEIAHRLQVIAAAPFLAAGLPGPRPMRVPRAERRVRKRHDRTATICDLSAVVVRDEAAKEAHYVDATSPLRVRCAWQYVTAMSNNESGAYDYYFTIWCIHYGYDPHTWERRPRPQSIQEISALLYAHGVPAPSQTLLEIVRSETRPWTKDDLRTYHRIAREVNHGAQLRMLQLLESDTPIHGLRAEDRAALAASLKRKWTRDHSGRAAPVDNP